MFMCGVNEAILFHEMCKYHITFYVLYALLETTLGHSTWT